MLLECLNMLISSNHDSDYYCKPYYFVLLTSE